MPSPKQASVQLPILDISQTILSPSSSLSSISQACKDLGFFLITNHGISQDLYNSLCSLSNHLFNLPLDTKLLLGPSTLINTYTPFFMLNQLHTFFNHGQHFIASPFFESLRVSGPHYYSSAKSSADLLFTNNTNTDYTSQFCSVMEEYGNKMVELSKRIIAVVLECLGDGFEMKGCESEYSQCHGYLRINNYIAPEVAQKEEEEGNCLGEIEGLGMHTDMSCITVLYQDESGGLQVRSKEGWVDIETGEGTLVVNIGDLLQAWSNGRMRSSAHRVLLKKKKVRRMSLAFFWCFEDEKVIMAPSDVVGEGKERIYRPFVCKEYVEFRQSSVQGG
ncbi:Gibberellin 3-beta-dioxygenase protein [Dioscorea alata]|uniref:Gibberellin 3-beta-dioxygenase protein n=1 Tax=Dioscorea alata TaxID=55571 RepID=A0ACB7WR78_DIOAL|nr:Gibberellin 3-beta-dioxygenase protein [Dioscorea alata]